MKRFKNILFGLVFGVLAACSSLQATITNILEFQNEAGQKVIFLCDYHTKDQIVHLFNSQKIPRGKAKLLIKKANAIAREHIRCLIDNFDSASFLVEDIDQKALEFRELRDSLPRSKGSFLHALNCKMSERGKNIINIETRHQLMFERFKRLLKSSCYFKTTPMEKIAEQMISKQQAEVNHGDKRPDSILGDYYRKTIWEMRAKLEIANHRAKRRRKKLSLEALYYHYVIPVMQVIDMEIAHHIYQNLRDGEKTIVVCAGAGHCYKTATDIMPLLEFTRVSRAIRKKLVDGWDETPKPIDLAHYFSLETHEAESIFADNAAQDTVSMVSTQQSIQQTPRPSGSYITTLATTMPLAPFIAGTMGASIPERFSPQAAMMMLISIWRSHETF